MIVKNEEKVAWAAGLFEGEGCFSLDSNGVTMISSLLTTDKDVMDEFYAVVDCGSVCKATNTALQKKQAYRWTTAQKGTEKIFKMFSPFLGIRRKQRYLELVSQRQVTFNIKNPPRLCAICEEEFIPNIRGGNLQKFCSYKCQCRRKKNVRYT